MKALESDIASAGWKPPVSGLMQGGALGSRLSVPGNSAGLYAAMFQGNRHPALLDNALARRVIVHQYARDFCRVTLLKRGTDDKAVLSILKQVSRLGLVPEFDATVTQLAGQPAVPIVQREFSGNLFERFFKASMRKECLDYLTVGRNTFSATPGEYRRYGMWKALADFGRVCMQRPWMSAGIIGSVAWLGERYPFLGGLSGLVILAWSSVATVMHELKAHRMPQMNAQKSRQYIRSGENLTAFLLTLTGIDGVWKGTMNGLRAAQKAGETLESANPVSRVAQRSWQAIRARQPENKMTAFESLRFVGGLFDNVLLPFNAIANKLEHNQ